MAAASGGYHENYERLKPATRDRHRAIVSIMEELEAADWYDQRIDATDDPELAAILAHNRDEEKEHAAMTLEWLRRHDAGFDQQLRAYLFTDKPVLAQEEASDQAHGEGGASGGQTESAADGSLGIGSLRERVRR